MKHLIVGIDAGKTAAVACIDLNGKVVKLATGRFVGLEWFVDVIKGVGQPVMVSGDKKRPTQLAEKISTAFDAVLFVPGSDMSVEKKRSMLEADFDNLHERDALASAMMAYNAYAGKLSQAERQARESATGIGRGPREGDGDKEILRRRGHRREARGQEIREEDAELKGEHQC